MIVYWIVFLICGLFCRIFRDSIQNTIDLNIVSIIAMIIVSVIVFFVIAEKSRNKTQIFILSISYVILCLLVITDNMIVALDGTDDNGFHIAAIMKSNGDYSWNYGGIYTDIVSCIYRIFGQIKCMGGFANTLFILSTYFLFLDILDYTLCDDQLKNFALLLLCFNPHFLIINSVLRRESIIVYITAFSLLCFIKYIKGYGYYNIILSLLFALVSCIFHSGCICYIVAYIFYLMFYDSEKNKIVFSKKTISVSFFALLMFIIIYTYFGETFFAKFANMENHSLIYNNGNGGAAYSVGINTGNYIIDIIVNLPIKSIYFLLSPMPWAWRGINDIIAFMLNSLFFL